MTCETSFPWLHTRYHCVKLRRCVVGSQSKLGWQVWFVVGGQSFHIGTDYFDTRKEAEWFASAFNTALENREKPK